jgi:hypothetical protein
VIIGNGQQVAATNRVSFTGDGPSVNPSDNANYGKENVAVGDIKISRDLAKQAYNEIKNP